MNITISGSLGNTGKPLTQRLVQAGQQVTVISSDASKKAAIEALGAKAAIGSISDTDFLKTALDGADALFAMTPPNIGGSNVIANTTAAGKAYAKAIAATGVAKVVMLSSVGAEYSTGNGPIAAIHNIEQLYHELPDTTVTFLRAGYFYLNFYNDIPVIKAAGTMLGNFPGSTIIPMVHPEDIALIAAEELQLPSKGKKVRHAVSDVKTATEVARILGSAIGKADLPWTEITDEQYLHGLEQAGLPKEIAALYTEMGGGLREGKLSGDFIKSGSPVDGKIKLTDFAKDFAQKYQ
ncbi:MAG: NAD-dependent dehydratase [Citrobacter freundii]|nr:MAG: NAD-dependent dehydratase [Citrobacter freundii]